MSKCILLDFDDTIYNFSESIKYAFFSMILESKLNRDQTVKLLNCLGDHFEKVFFPINQKMCSDEFRVDSLFLKEAFDYYSIFNKAIEMQSGKKSIITRDEYYGWFLAKCKVLPTVRDALTLFRNCGFYIGLLSDGLLRDKIVVLDYLRLREYFDVIVTSQDTSCVKPSENFVSYTESKLGIKRDTFVYVGNHISDYTLAKNAGIRFFAFNPDVRLWEYIHRNNVCCLDRLSDLGRLFEL